MPTVAELVRNHTSTTTTQQAPSRTTTGNSARWRQSSAGPPSSQPWLADITLIDVQLPPHLAPYVSHAEHTKVVYGARNFTANDFWSLHRDLLTYTSPQGLALVRACWGCQAAKVPCLADTGGDAARSDRGCQRCRERHESCSWHYRGE